MKFWERPDFLALQRDWYSRLARVGFCDAEEMVGHDMVLRQSAAHPLRHESDIEAKEIYFSVLGEKVQVHAFAREVDRIIMEMRAEGAKITSICEELRRRGYQRDRQAVRFRIRIYEMQWGLGKYTRKQLGRKVG